MRIRWTPAATEDLESIVRFIRKDSSETARQVADEILQSLKKLLTFPGLGRPGNKPGTRELVVPPMSSCTVLGRISSNRYVSGMALNGGDK